MELPPREASATVFGALLDGERGGGGHFVFAEASVDFIDGGGEGFIAFDQKMIFEETQLAGFGRFELGEPDLRGAVFAVGFDDLVKETADEWKDFLGRVGGAVKADAESALAVVAVAQGDVYFGGAVLMAAKLDEGGFDVAD